MVRVPFNLRLRGNKRYQSLLAGPPQTRGMRSGYVVLRPGESVGEHTRQKGRGCGHTCRFLQVQLCRQAFIQAGKKLHNLCPCAYAPRRMQYR
jgi:hypothetical protein